MYRMGCVQLSVRSESENGYIKMSLNLTRPWACAASFVDLCNRRPLRYLSTRPQTLCENASDDALVRSYANCEVLLSRTLRSRSK